MLVIMHTPSKDFGTVPRLIAVEEAADLLGVGRTAAYGLIANGALKSLKIGKRRLVPISAIEDFIQRSLDADG